MAFIKRAMAGDTIVVVFVRAWRCPVGLPITWVQTEIPIFFAQLFSYFS